MSLHLPTLMTVCIAALATSAAVMTLHGLTQRTYRGYGWWVAAQWLLALGCLLHLFRDSSPELSTSISRMRIDVPALFHPYCAGAADGLASTSRWIAPGMASRPSPVRARAMNREPSRVLPNETPARSMKMNWP